MVQLQNVHNPIFQPVLRSNQVKSSQSSYSRQIDHLINTYNTIHVQIQDFSHTLSIFIFMFISRAQMFSTERKLFALQIQENKIFTEWRKERLPSCGILFES